MDYVAKKCMEAVDLGTWDVVTEWNTKMEELGKEISSDCAFWSEGGGDRLECKFLWVIAILNAFKPLMRVYKKSLKNLKIFRC